ncbi:MAG: Cobalt-precorrin-5B C(1)-methyltransferase [Syntrophus sp. SKADARSKE-3]|nr:Cobalt-precorrin-5B C(1)-methyltransferase [Syntrophus sp. SKADARSKE-3]
MTSPRDGFTTGTCAAAAAKAATLLLETDIAPVCVDIMLPDGERATLPVLYTKMTDVTAEAGVRKDAGDDPDITDGAILVAMVSRTGREGISLAGGEGVGTVTKPGLSVAPGEPAINAVPRRMIENAVAEVAKSGVRVTISIPGGEALAAKTFNPRLGIVGGLSILGTSGRVRPFSCPAMRASLQCLLDVAVAGGVAAPVFVPGRIGERAAKRHLSIADEQLVAVGNEWGFIVDRARECTFEEILIVGHPGKLAKLAAGDWDTHSSRSKSAVPWLSAFAAGVLGRPIPEASTVEGIIAPLDGEQRKRLGDQLAGRIRAAVQDRLGGKTGISNVLIDMKGEIIGTDGDLTRWQ